MAFKDRLHDLFHEPVLLLLVSLFFVSIFFSQSNSVDYGKRNVVITVSPEVIHAGDTVTVHTKTLSDDNISGLAILVVSTKSGSQVDLDHYNGTSDTHGRFTFVPRLAGEYSVEARHKDYRTVTKLITILPKVIPKLVVSQSLSICPENRFEIVIAADGKPVEGVLVSAGGISQTTDVTGTVLFTLSNGPYLFTAKKEGYEDGTLEISYEECKKEVVMPPPPEPAIDTPPQLNETELQMEAARESIAASEGELADAKKMNKDVVLAERKIIEAQAAYGAGEYVQAKNIAEEARVLIQSASIKMPDLEPVEESRSSLGWGAVALVAVIVAIIIGAIIFVNRKKLL